MPKFSVREKLILTFIITNCEIYALNEEEALRYIQFNFSTYISRRTFYNYKRIVYNNCSLIFNGYVGYGEKDFQSFKQPKITISINYRPLSRFLLLDLKEDLIQKGLEMGIDLNDYDRLNFFPTHFINSIDKANSVISHSRNFIERVKKRLH